MTTIKLVSGSRLGAQFPYTIERIFSSQGNMSHVCLASVAAEPGADLSMVVLKVARSGDQYSSFYEETLNNEVERLRRLKHPGVVRLFPIQRQGIPNLPYIAQATSLPGTPWFSVMEYLAGGSLMDLIEQGPMEIGMALEITRSVAGTLDYLHSRRQVHLDLKPDNLLFRTIPIPGEMMEPVLIDFGIARNVGQRGLEARTLQYAPPERVQEDHQDPNAASPHPAMDVYSLGVVLYEMLTGQLPFRGRSKKRMAAAILQGRLRPPSAQRSEIRPELDAIILKMMARNPDDRPTAEESAILLEEIAIKGGYLPRYPSRRSDGEKPVVHPAPRRSRSAWRLLFRLLLVLLVAAQLIFILGTHRYWGTVIDLSNDSLQTLVANIQQLYGELGSR
ncbi:MAG: serine/threonine-protein kinase [Chloroflexota bacterium]